MKKVKQDDTMLKIGYAILMGVFGVGFTTIAAIIFEEFLKNQAVITPLQLIFAISFAIIMVFAMIKVFSNENADADE